MADVTDGTADVTDETGSSSDPTDGGRTSARTSIAVTDNGESPAAAEPPTAGTPPPDAGDFGPDRVEADSPDHIVRRREGRRRRAGWIMLATGVLILAGTAWVGWRSYQAYSHLKTASADVSRLQDELRDMTTFDPAAAAGTIDHLRAESAVALSAVDDPVFRAATVLPWLGANLSAVGDVTVTVDSLATEVAPSLVRVAQTLRPADLAPRAGAIDLAPIEQSSAVLQSADAAVNASRARMAGIDRSALLAPVNNAVLTLWRKLDDAAAVTGTGARAARLLPPMLGAHGSRTYLVVFQNLAEPRATGGIFGSSALVHADNGKISIAHGTPTRNLGRFDPPIVDLSRHQLALYTPVMARYPADVNLTPDFPTAAALFAKMYSERTGSAIDGVVAVDPVALSYLLRGSSPIDVGDGMVLTSDSLVRTLLATAYQKFPDASNQTPRDEFLARASTAAFTGGMSGKGDPVAMVDGLRQAIGERRVLVWSTEAKEQADLGSTTLAGAILQTAANPTIGVYLNDGTGAKLGYYLHNQVKLTAGRCRTDGRRELDVTIRLRYAAPSKGLPAYVLGEGVPGRRPYALQTNVLVSAPVGGSVVEAARDGIPASLMRGEDTSHEVGSSTVILQPGGSAEITVRVLAPASPPGAAVTPELQLTPGVNPWTVAVDSYPSCLPSQ